MSITEIKQALGGWEVRLREGTPREILDRLTFFGHIAVVPGRVDPTQYGDNLLTTARYVGVYRGRDAQDNYTLKGSGMAFWLGDEDDKGDVIETAVTLTAQTFAASVAALLPSGGAVTAGTINSVAGTYTGRHQWETPRSAIDYVTETFNAEWRVNGNGTLDAGTIAQLYNVTPRAVLVRKGAGSDLARKAFLGKMTMGVDIEDTTTRVVLLAEGEGDSIATGDANAPPTAYKDIHGNFIKVTRVVSESETSDLNADARAQITLNRFLNPRRAVNLSTAEYDIKGTFVVGDYLEVYDPENGFYDNAREVYWNGDRINPMALRCVEMSWPVIEGWTVAFRDINGAWIDLSSYYIPESGQTTIVVGDLARGLSSVGGEPIGIRPNLPSNPANDITVPAAPVFGDFSTGSYQPADGEWTKAAILATWTEPLNGDSSTITDGGHYEIRYRVNAFIGYGVRWGQMAPYRWGSLSGNRWGAPITDPISSGEWNVVFVPWNQEQILIQELTPGVEYEFQIRAIDSASPPHQGPWSASEFIIASGDLFAPSEPAAPSVASSRLAIQVTHDLGRASGGTFNLEPDLVYLAIHVGDAPGFTPDDTNRVGKLLANSGMITANVPAVGTFQVESTTDVWVKVVAVDRSGNHSPSSTGAQSSADLIDSAHISDLTVSKLTAGTMTAAVILAGSIKTATSGARVEQDAAGLRAYSAAGTQTFEVDAATGDVDIIGRFEARSNVGASIVIEPVLGGDDPFIKLVAANAVSNRGHISAFSFGSIDTFEISSKDIATDGIDGGYMWLGNGGISMRHRKIGDANDLGTVQVNNSGVLITAQPSAGTEISLSMGTSFSGVMYGRGLYAGGANHADCMFFGGQGTVGAGFGGIAVGYGVTITGPRVTPTYAISGAGATFYHCLTAFSLTGFTLSWSGADSHSYFWRAVRD